MKIERETANIVEAIQTEYETAKSQEERLTAALDTQKAEALALNRKSIGYRALERDATSNRQIFESLLQRTKETTISGELKTNSIRIADAADIPRSPVWPQKRRNFLFAICAGALLAVVLAFFVEYMDNKIKTPDDIKWDLGVTCLGMVPKIDYKPANGGSPLLNNGVPPNFSEAFRSLRTNVLFSVNGGRINSLVVTSTAPGEGKTLIASNLAVGLALAGQRVLLMDADMRRPRAHSVFGLPQEPGLSDLMVDQTKKVADVVSKCDVPNLWVLPAGHLPPEPGRTAQLEAIPQVPGKGAGAVRLGHRRFAAGHGRDRRVDPRLSRFWRALRHRSRRDEPAGGRAGDGAARGREGEADRRCSQSRRRRPQRLLLLRRITAVITRTTTPPPHPSRDMSMTLALLIPDGAGVRNFLLGPFLAHAAARGPVVAFHRIPENLLQAVTPPDVPVQWRTLVTPRDSRLALVLRNTLAFAHMYWADTASMRYSLGLRFGGSWRTRAAMRAARVLGRLSGSPRGIRRLDRLHAALVGRTDETADYCRIFENIKPSVVLCSNQRAGSGCTGGAGREEARDSHRGVHLQLGQSDEQGSQRRVRSITTWSGAT